MQFVFSLPTDRHRFAMLAAGIGVAVCISSTYCFSIFSNSLKREYNLGQDDITTISTIGTACGLFSMPAGIMFDFIGPQIVLLFATIIMGTGYLLWLLAFSGVLDGGLFLFCLANSCVLLGSGWMDVGSLMTCILNFPRLRGSVVVLQKTFMGLGSTIIATCFVAFFESSLQRFACFMLVVVLSFGLSGAFIINLPHYYVTTQAAKKMSHSQLQDSKKSLENFSQIPASARRLTYGFSLLAMNMIFLTSYNIVAAYTDLSKQATQFCAATAVVLLFGFVLLPFIPSENGENPVDDHQFDNDALLNTTESLIQIPQFQTSFFQNFKRPILWCLVWTTFCNIGTGVVIVSNSAQIYRAINDNVFVVSTNALIIALMGVASALARVIVGSIDMWMERRRRISRDILSVPLLTAFYPVSSLIAVIGAALLLVLPASALLLPFVLLSMSYGFIWATTALCTRLMFAKDVGKHYNFGFLSAVASTVCLNRFLFGELYDREARLQGTYPFCTGVSCIRTTMLVIIGLNASAVFTALYVHVSFKGHCIQELKRKNPDQS
jgi:MFS family permease